MKKVFLITMVAIFMCSLTFAKTTTNSQDCIDYAIAAMDEEVAANGEMGDEEWGDGAMFYYNACEDAGGSNNINNLGEVQL